MPADKQKRIDQLKPNYHQSIAKDILQRFVFRVRDLRQCHVIVIFKES